MRWPGRSRPTRRPAWELEPLRGRTDPANTMVVGALVYRGVTTAEIDEPVTRLAEMLRADVVFVGAVAGRVPGVEPARPIVVDHGPETAPPIDVLVVPGGLGWKQVIADDVVRDWLASAATSARGILAISTGSLLLASVGRLEGRDATGHWLAEDDLAALGANVQRERVAHDEMGRVVTASGALAAMRVIELLADSTLWSR